MYLNTFNDAMRRQFGCKIYKLALDGGFTCPNRDGTLGFGGCIFCSGQGSGDFAVRVEGDIPGQMEKARRIVENKVKDGRYMAYFQSFTNTYAPTERLEPLFRSAMAPDDVAAISIATRPDCLEPEKIRLLASLNREKPVFVELGLQTVNPATARYIRRGYELPVFDDAVVRLQAAGLRVVVHMILGLPGETVEDMTATARHIGRVGADGVKLQLLHVLEGTDLAADYRAGKFRAMELGEYIEALAACIRALPREMVIHRMTGDGAKRDLIAPKWSADKKRVLNQINAAFREMDLEQGSDWIAP